LSNCQCDRGSSRMRPARECQRQHRRHSSRRSTSRRNSARCPWPQSTAAQSPPRKNNAIVKPARPITRSWTRIAGTSPARTKPDNTDRWPFVSRGPKVRRLAAGGRWIRNFGSWSRDRQAVMGGGLLSKRERICRGTEGSNPSPSSGESPANLSFRRIEVQGRSRGRISFSALMWGLRR